MFRSSGEAGKSALLRRASVHGSVDDTALLVLADDPPLRKRAGARRVGEKQEDGRRAGGGQESEDPRRARGVTSRVEKRSKVSESTRERSESSRWEGCAQ